MDCGRSELYHPIVPHKQMQNMWKLSVFDSDSSDFPDTGDPDFCLGMLRSPNDIGNVESVCGTALLARGGGGGGLFPDAPGLSAGVCSDVARPPGSEGLASSGGLWLYKDGNCH